MIQKTQLESFRMQHTESGLARAPGPPGPASLAASLAGGSARHGPPQVKLLARDFDEYAIGRTGRTAITPHIGMQMHTRAHMHERLGVSGWVGRWVDGWAAAGGWVPSLTALPGIRLGEVGRVGLRLLARRGRRLWFTRSWPFLLIALLHGGHIAQVVSE